LSAKTIGVRIPASEVELWFKAKGDRSWKEIAETGLFGDHKPFDVVTYDEMQAYVDQKIAEALSKK
jgi:hypothetical protein